MKVLQAEKWIPVCQLADLEANEGVCVLINGEQIAVFYLPDENIKLYAMANWDPIGKANVMSRGIVGDSNGELVVASPLYKQHFSLVTGKCLEETGVTVPVYEVALDGDTVVIGFSG
jgi:nitrite reductase (NADH) small subunit